MSMNIIMFGFSFTGGPVLDLPPATLSCFTPWPVVALCSSTRTYIAEARSALHEQCRSCRLAGPSPSGAASHSEEK
jgi:hypothetical protein